MTSRLKFYNYLQLNNIPSLVVAVIINISPVTTVTCYWQSSTITTTYLQFPEFCQVIEKT